MTTDTLAPPAPNLVVVNVHALEAALTTLKLSGVTAAQLLDAIKKEESHPATTPSSSTPSGSARTMALLELVKNPPQDQHGSIPPYESTFTMEAVKGPDDADRARRLKLRELAMKDFPGGKIPDPYTTVWLNLSDGAAKDLPFIQATITVSPYEWPKGTAKPVQKFEHVWVLWDTGAQASQILSSKLHDNIKKDDKGHVQHSGFAIAEVQFTGVHKVIESNIAFRQNMPNNTTFIILGQHTLLNCIQYHVQPTVVNPSLKHHNPHAYGQIDLLHYRDPVNPHAPVENL